jgi:hypothetical protein
MKKNKAITVSGFFPFLNDWGTIGSLVATLDDALNKYCHDYEIIIVDDGGGGGDDAACIDAGL